VTEDDIFYGMAHARTRIVHFCQTGSMDLWMGLQIVDMAVRGVPRRPRKFKMFPYAINPDCKCSACRYFRWRNTRSCL
jgi:hypothetical protein